MATDNTHRLTRMGPRDDRHGYPLWFEDETGLRLELGLGPDRMLPAVGDIPSPGAPLGIPGNFPDESFYFMAEARMPVGGVGVVGRARLILAVEAAFGGPGLPDATARVVFSRIRVRMDDLIPGAPYVVTHPYGVTDPLVADDRGRVFVTDDRGIADEVFDGVLTAGRVAPFLRWETGAPAGYLGDGVSERRVTGSPFGTNIFRVDGPRVSEGGGPRDPADPGNADRVQTDLFTVQGKLATRMGVRLDGATYSRSSTGAVTVAVQASSVVGQVVETVQPRVVLGTGGDRYAAHISVPAAPPTITVRNYSDAPATSASGPVTDLVLVDDATWDAGAGTLVVTARSSDETGVALTAVGLGALTTGGGGATGTFTGVAGAPAEVVVTSSAGGRGLRPVRTVGATATELPPRPPEPVPPDPGPVHTPTVAIDRCQFRTGTAQFRISGTCSGDAPTRVTVTLEATPAFELGSATVDATGAWAVRRTLTAAESSHAPGVGATVTAASDHGGSATADVAIRN